MAPLALVYRGRATCPGCPEAVARLLHASGFQVAYVGDSEEYPLTAESMARAAVYAQPGGGELRPAWRRMRSHADTIRDFVRSGGQYLGFCLGGYLAGEDPGFGLFDGEVLQYVRSQGAEIRTVRPTVLELDWSGNSRRIYFQDGCAFRTGRRGDVVARYRNGLAAAVVSPFGEGRLAVVGPHPEATDDWYRDDDLIPVNPPTLDLGLDLISRLTAW